MNVYEEIAAKIIDRIDQGEIVWQKPWCAAFACKSGATGNAYSLLNQMLLGARPGYYYTFNQIKERGGMIKKGTKAAPIFFFTTYQTKETKEKLAELQEEEGGTWIAPSRVCLKRYNVFHQDDITGIELPRVDNSEGYDHDLDLTAEAVITNYVEREKINLIVKKCDSAFYRPSEDSVTVPAPELFKDLAEYYSTLFHELGHSTMKNTRCDRPTTGLTFGSKGYAREELVAEISSAMLCHATNVDTEKAFNNSIAYLQSWRKVLTEDPAAIVWATSRAEKAARYILG